MIKKKKEKIKFKIGLSFKKCNVFIVYIILSSLENHPKTINH